MCAPQSDNLIFLFEEIMKIFYLFFNFSAVFKIWNHFEMLRYSIKVKKKSLVKISKNSADFKV